MWQGRCTPWARPWERGPGVQPRMWVGEEAKREGRDRHISMLGGTCSKPCHPLWLELAPARAVVTGALQQADSPL